MSAARPILVVDDDEDIREVVAMAIDAMGYSVQTAADGVEALQLLSSGTQPSLVLLDMMMPRMDGEAFLAAVRSDPRLAALPIVLLSGRTLASDRAAELQADGCLVKPVGLDELISVVRRFARTA